MTGDRVVILNSWDDAFAEYHRYIDHARHRVGYVTVEEGLGRLDTASAAALEVVSEIAAGSELNRAVARVAESMGGIDRIVALSEFDLLVGAALRDRLGIPGPGVDAVTRFTDKTAMKAAVRAAGLTAPAWCAADRPGDVAALIEACGFPVVVKPRHGAASRGVETIGDADALAAALERLPKQDYELEAFVDGPILHVDGVMRDGLPAGLRVSRYVGTCLGFARGRPLGSVTLEPGPEAARMEAFARASLAALGLTDGAFHLELIDSPDLGPCFLEVGARIGGGEIPFTSLEVFGIDLLALWLAVEFGEPLPPPGPSKAPHAGFLMIPQPSDRPCRVVERSSMLGRIDGLYAEVLPEPGDVLDPSGGYARIGGRFRYAGPDEDAITRAIERTVRDYRLTTEPLPRDRSASAAE